MWTDATITADTLLRTEPHEGRTEPIHVRCDDEERYIVKYPHDDINPLYIINQVIGSELCRQCGLSTPEIRRVLIPKEIIQAIDQPATGDIIGCGSKFIIGSIPIILDQTITGISPDEAFIMTFFDVWTLNEDRPTIGNYRVLREKDRIKIIAIDHDLCFMDQHGPWDTNTLLKDTDRYRVEEDVMIKALALNYQNGRDLLGKIEAVNIENAVHEPAVFPSEWSLWYNNESRLGLIEFLEKRRGYLLSGFKRLLYT